MTVDEAKAIVEKIHAVDNPVIQEALDTVLNALPIQCNNYMYYRAINGEIGECNHVKGTQWYVSKFGYCDRAMKKWQENLN